jgi:hypothetical protein
MNNLVSLVVVESFTYFPTHSPVSPKESDKIYSADETVARFKLQDI